jgi:putative aldouronate transport system substrate-binding protein
MGRYIAAYKKDPKSTFYVRPIAAPSLTKGEKGWNFQFDTITTGQGAAISTKTRHAREATKWLDFHYDQKQGGHMLMNFGVEGLSWKKDANGNPVLTDEVLNSPKGYSIDVALGQFSSGASGEAQMLDPIVRQYRMWSMPVQREASLLWNGDQGPARQMPPITLTSAEASKFASKMNDVWSLTNEATTKFIMGQKPLSEFDAYIAQLKSIGIDDLIAIQQAALDRYSKR